MLDLKRGFPSVVERDLSDDYEPFQLLLFFMAKVLRRIKTTGCATVALSGKIPANVY